MKCIFRILAVLLCLCSLSAISQSTNASLSGGVTDSSGRYIEGAEITIANDATGVLYATRTNDSGIYFAPPLPPGRYRVQVAKQGFKTIIKPDVVLNVQSALALNFSLPLGSTSESITVEGSSALLNTSNASVSTVVDRKFVESIPLNGRSFQDLISMTPGVVSQSPQTSQTPGFNGDVSVNGQRTESNYYTVDGVSANVGAGAPNGGPQAATSGSLSAGTALGTTQSLVSVDALQEFRVSSSTYSAEYGRSPGGQFSLVTRSGTKVIHGSVFDYLRNDFFDANNWFNNHYGRGITPLRQNDFGGTVGGPIPISTSRPGYFFVSYEGLRLTQPQAASIQFVPSLALRQSAPAVLRPILNAFPLPNGVTYSSGLAQFIEPYSLPSSVDSTGVRIDQIVSPHLSLFFRIGDSPSSTNGRSLSVRTIKNFSTQTYTFGATSQISSRLTNELRLGYARSNASTRTTLDSFGGAAPIDLAAAMGNDTSGNSGTAFQMPFTGTGEGDLQQSANINQSRQWNLVDTFSVSAGRHQWKFGVDYRRIKSPLHPQSPYVSGIYSSQASVLNNAADTAILSKVLPATPIFQETAVFMQDEWRLEPRFAVSAGIRWEVNPPPFEQHGNDAFTLVGSFADPASLSVAPRGTSLWKTSWYNFAPRLGIAWTINDHAGWETVFRTGGGVFFDTGNQIAATGYQYLGFSAIQVKSKLAFPVTPAQLAFTPSTSAPYTSTTVIAFPQHLQLPYTLQWNASVQQSLGKMQTFTLSYVGSEGRRLLRMQQFSLGSLNPNFANVNVITTGTTSNYQALQLQFQRSVSPGLQALASYTWSHSLDFGSNNSALAAIRGNSDFDVRNNLQAGLSWDLPGEGTAGILNFLRTGWAADGRVVARTSFPVTLRGSLQTNRATGESYNGNVSIVPGQPFYLYGAQYPGGRAVNRGAFQLPVAGNPGNAPRNFIRGFGATQVNLAIRRSFNLHENLRMVFRAEAFNLLNHPIFGLVNATLSDALFGQATQTLNQSLATMSAQYQQGGPRSLQFALKFQF